MQTDFKEVVKVDRNLTRLQRHDDREVTRSAPVIEMPYVCHTYTIVKVHSHRLRVYTRLDARARTSTPINERYRTSMQPGEHTDQP